MNIIEIENKRLDLLSNLNNRTSSRQKLYLIEGFFNTLLQCNDQEIIYSYLLEFSDEFVKNLEEWNVFYLPPMESERILKLAKTLKNHSAFKLLKEKLVLAISKLGNKYHELDNILKGSNILDPGSDGKIYFPVLEDDGISNNGEMYGYLESMTVKISKTSSQNRFIIVPSLKVIEEKLNDQIKISWEKAVEILKKHRSRINQFHDVIIDFDQRLGEYVGNSLGIALTLAFLQELFTFYNTPIKLKVSANLAFTGGINEAAEIIPLRNEEYIRSKIRSVFYSPVTGIILSRKDEELAKNELEKLLENYPDRKLKIIGVDEFNDLLNRRDIVSIKKQNPVIRTGKFIRKQKIAFIVVIITILGFLYANINIDNNPAFLTNIKNYVYVHNKNGRILWRKEIAENVKKQKIDEVSKVLYEKVININNDKKNEVLLPDFVISKRNNVYDNFIACFNYKGVMIWKYRFEDSVETGKDAFNKTYESQIIDTISENGRLEIILYSRNDPLYPSAIYKLDAKTGTRLPGTFWHAGHICAVNLDDFNRDGKKEIVATAISNCYERCVLFSIDVDKIWGQGPSNKDYKFNGVPKADFNHYLLLPKSDLTDVYSTRFNTTPRTILGYNENDKYFRFSLIEGDPSKFDAGIEYMVNNTFSNIKIFIGDNFQVIRDSLVSSGKLHKPYSNTQAYIKLLRRQIKYWDGKEFKRMY